MCVQSGSLKPTWGFFKGKKHTKKPKTKKNTKQQKKQWHIYYTIQVVLVFADDGVFMLVSFLENYSTLGKVAKSLLFGFCFGKLVGKWHFKRSLFFLKKLS